MAAIEFTPVAGPQGSVGVSGAAPTVGIQGGGVTANAAAPAASYFTSGMTIDGGVHPEFIEGLFKNQLAAAKTDRMYKGFVDGVAGVTSEEVRDKQPWYTKLFGPTDYESGVQMYETQKKVSHLATQWQQNMPTLREMPTEQVGEMLTAEMRNLQTNNPMTNMILQKNMMETFAPLIQQHGKERVAWQQSQLVKQQVEAAEARNAQYQAMMSSAATLGENRPMDKQTAENMQYAQKGLLDAWSTGRLQNDDSRKAFLMTTAKSAARQGQFYVLETLRQNGFMDSLDASTGEQFEKLYETAQATSRNKFATDNAAFSKMLGRAAALKGFGIGGERMTNMMREINDTYTAMTGSPRPYFDADQIAEYAGAATSSALRRQERAEDQQERLMLANLGKEDKELMEERNNAEAKEFIINGTAGEAQNLKYVEKGDLDRNGLAQFDADMQAGKPEQAAGRLILNFNNMKGSYTNDMLKDRLRTNLESSMDESVNDAFMSQYSQWKQLYDGHGFDEDGTENNKSAGRATAVSYYGPQVNEKMVEFDRKVNTMGPERAYATTFGEWVSNGRPDFRGIERGDQKVATKAFLAAVDKQGAGWFDRTFGNGFALHPSARQQLSAALAPYWEQLGDSGQLPQHRAMAALQLAKSDDGGRIEVIGGLMLRHSRNQQALTKYMNDPDSTRTSVLFSSVMEQKAKEVGTSVGPKNSVDVVRLQDDHGVPQYSVQVWDEEGFKDFSLTGQDLMDFEKKKLKASEVEAAARRKRVSLGDIPVPTVEETAPIYDPNDLSLND